MEKETELLAALGLLFLAALGIGLVSGIIIL